MAIEINNNNFYKLNNENFLPVKLMLLLPNKDEQSDQKYHNVYI